MLYYRPEDLALGRFFSSAVPKRQDVDRVVNAIAGESDMTRDEVRDATGLGSRRLGRILNLIELATAVVEDSYDDHDGLVDAVIGIAESHRTLERSRVEMMRGYAETTRCRAQFLLGYFGEDLDHICGHCDNCAAGTAEERDPAEATAYPLQSRVAHPQFGPGIVMDLEPGKITVLFDDAGYRPLDLAAVADEALLEPC